MAYSKELIDLYRRYRTLTSYQERRECLIELAAQYAREHDDTDHEKFDDLHDLVEDFEATNLRLTHISLNLGRFVVGLIEEGCEIDTSTESAPDSDLN